jgi:pimeloyl-ACP methyl ester carboxylesterase
VLYACWSLVIAAFAPVAISAGIRLGPGAEPGHLSPRARKVEFPTKDGLTLRGIYLEPSGDHPVLLLCHGIRANKRDWIPWARILAKEGYGILAFDWRGHGESDGRWISYGAVEGADLEAADAFLDARAELAGRPRAVLAISLGAAMVALNADRLGPEYRCMVLDSPYGSLERMLDHRFSVFGPFAWLPAQLLRGTGGLWLGRWLTAMRPEEGVKAFAPRPLLVLHGAADRTIPVAEGRALFEAYTGAKESWFQEWGHTAARWEDTEAWTARVTGFLERNL